MCDWDMRNREIFSVFVRGPVVRYRPSKTYKNKIKHAHVIIGDAPIFQPVPVQERELMPGRRTYRGRRTDPGDTAGTGKSTHLNKNLVSNNYVKLDTQMLK